MKLSNSEIKARLGFGVNGEVQRFFTNDCAIHMDKFIPFDTGVLRNLKTIGFDYVDYLSPHAHYMYNGELYVDPITGKGAFYNPDYGFWSRPNTEKIPSGIDLNYHTPGTGAFWDKRMWSAEGKDVIKDTQNFMRGQ